MKIEDLPHLTVEHLGDFSQFSEWYMHHEGFGLFVRCYHKANKRRGAEPGDWFVEVSPSSDVIEPLRKMTKSEEIKVRKFLPHV